MSIAKEIAEKARDAREAAALIHMALTEKTPDLEPGSDKWKTQADLLVTTVWSLSQQRLSRAKMCRALGLKTPLGGPRDGAGRPANIAGALARLERSIAAEERRPTLKHAEAAALFARADALSERIERLMVAAPDYSE
jgi:hypothetical protein